MKIKLVGAESMGVRSMATYLETRGLKIFIDPGVALAPWRYGLPPHPIELEERERVWREVVRLAEKSDVIVITHYHYDHFNPREALYEVYHDKTLLIKDPENSINPSQIRRSHFLLHRLAELGVKPHIKIADGKYFMIGDVEIMFSNPIPHGHDSRLGYVVMLSIDDGKYKFLYSSDVEGPFDEDAVEFIIGCRPKLLYLDGPMTYLLGMLLNENVVDKCLDNLIRILSTVPLDKLILDHHFMRDINYLTWIESILKMFSGGKDLNIISAAEFMGKSLNMLEASRQKLYEEHPV